MSATMFENDLDRDFFTLVDFELAPPCDLGINQGCVAKVEWKFFTNCCGTLYLTCPAHLDHLREWVNTEALRKTVGCKRCKKAICGPEFIVGLEKI